MENEELGCKPVVVSIMKDNRKDGVLNKIIIERLLMESLALLLKLMDLLWLWVVEEKRKTNWLYVGVV